MRTAMCANCGSDLTDKEQVTMAVTLRNPLSKIHPYILFLYCVIAFFWYLGFKYVTKMYIKILNTNNTKNIIPCSYKASKFLAVAIAIIFSSIKDIIIISAA